MQSENKKLNECLHAAFPLPELPQSLCAEVVSERLAGKKPRRAVPLYVVRTAAAAAVCLFAVGLALMLPLLAGGGMGGAAAESESAAPGDVADYDYYGSESKRFGPDNARSDTGSSVMEDAAAGAETKNESFSYAADMCMQLAVGECACIALDGPTGDFIIRCADSQTGAENNAVCSAWFTAVDGEGLLLWVEGTAEGAITLQVTELLLLDHDTPREYTLSVIVEGEVPHAD